VVQDEQFGLTYEHPRSGGPLDLATGEFHATRPDQRIEPAFERTDVWFQNRRVNRAVDRCRVLRAPEEQVLAKGLAEQMRHLRGVRSSRWHEENARILYQ